MKASGTLVDATGELIDLLRSASHPLNDANDLEPLMERIGDARYVLLGEASHGTSEYYRWRAKITQRLIAEKNFSFVAVEGDWPDCYRLNRYVKGYDEAGDRAVDVLYQIDRWPTWMWANWEVAAFSEWLRRFNREEKRNTGFYGLDVYSLWESMEEILGYLEKNDPEVVSVARRAFHCFEPYAEDVQSYAWSTTIVPEGCQNEVVDLLTEMRRRVPKYGDDPESRFDAEQNALIMVNAERYYRAMVRGGASSWNVRDTHMVETLNRLMEHHGPDAKSIIWEHNTHIGDARATDMAGSGMVNVGQLVRQQHHDEGVVLVGFGSHHGSVIAGDEWGAPMQAMPVPDARQGSWEYLFRQAGNERALLLTDDLADNDAAMNRLGHRAIGVVYHPERERFGNYVPTVLPGRYDAFIYIEETEALHPLHIKPREAHEPPETYPWGM
jgi:erythromycin esterase-like protein